MNHKLADILKKIGDEFRNQISPGSRFYLEIDIGRQAAKYGHCGLEEKYDDIYAIVPLKCPVRGMKVRIDGRTFVNYAQFESGVIVPKNVAGDAGLSHKAFVPKDSMILNFA